VGGVTLVGDRLPVRTAGGGTAAPLDGVVDVVVRHAELLGPLDGIEERRVAGDVTAPVRAATSMFLIIFAKSLPRLASMTPFLCLVVAHLE